MIPVRRSKVRLGRVPPLDVVLEVPARVSHQLHVVGLDLGAQDGDVALVAVHAPHQAVVLVHEAAHGVPGVG